MQHRAPRPLIDAWRRLPGVAARRIGHAAGRAPTRVVVALAAVLALGAGGFGVVASVGDGTERDQSEPAVAAQPDATHPPVTTGTETPDRGAGGTADHHEESSAPPSPASSGTSQPGEQAPTRAPESVAVPTPGAESPTTSPRPVTSRAGGDHTAPDTTLAADHPEPDAATFTFSAQEPASFTCSLDEGAFTACSSPVTYADLDPGWHTFAVRATDAAGNVDTTPAQARWLATRGDTTGDGRP